ncbi:GAF domain-containing hybrid sensor histidine kinase/response regulator [Bradyrhizobium sp. AZCC 1708]|uniref:GAF domain-containing hybrid sensor histidine kinase/response regulator n=1 Tax=Bradyrhizobium sp. AZCC 1708 TaxID=3117015 RepID=UPI002FF0EB42
MIEVDDLASAPGEITAAQWRQIVNGATETAIISTDERGLVTSWNSGASRILGWNEPEMLGQSLGRIFAEEDGQARLRREMEDAIAHGRGGGEEGWRVRKDGSRLWAVGELSPIREGAKIIGFVKILRDRTVQRETEEIIREERHALEVLNRAGSALALETDLQRLVQIVTDAGVELSGAEFGAFFYNVTNQAGESYMLYTLSGAPLEAFSNFPMPRNTEVFAPTFNGEGIVRSDDITKDPRYGKNPPRHGMPEGHLPVRSYLAVPVISRTGGVIGGLFFGHGESGVFSERSERGLSGLAAEAAIAIDNVRLSQASQREIEERKRAQEALVELNATLEKQVIERTEQLKRNEEALRQSQKMEAVGQLTGGVAHDFNNLLQVIIGNLDTLQRNIPSDSAHLQRAVRHAMNGAQRAASLTQRLLAFSRRQPLDPKPIDVNVLVNGLSEMVHRTLGETIAVETVLGAGLWRAEADPNELEAAILNLAVKIFTKSSAFGFLPSASSLRSCSTFSASTSPPSTRDARNFCPIFCCSVAIAPHSGLVLTPIGAAGQATRYVPQTVTQTDFARNGRRGTAHNLPTEWQRSGIWLESILAPDLCSPRMPEHENRMVSA